MTEASSTQSPFAAAVAPSPESGMRTMSPAEVGGILSAHRLYLETNRKQGARADLSSVDLAGMSFVGLNLRRVLFAHARLLGADLSRAEMTRANLIGANLNGAFLCRANLTNARLSGANLSAASLEATCLKDANLEFALLL